MDNNSLNIHDLSIEWFSDLVLVLGGILHIWFKCRLQFNDMSTSCKAPSFETHIYIWINGNAGTGCQYLILLIYIYIML